MRIGWILGWVGCAGATAPPDPVDEVWEGVVACGSVRVFASSGVRGLALETSVGLGTAVLDQTILDLSVSAVGTVQEGMTEGDLCGTIEEFPPIGGGPHWTISSGTMHLVFTPANGLTADDDSWTYDGTEIGRMQVELQDLELTPRDGALPSEVPDLELEVPVERPDLPA